MLPLLNNLISQSTAKYYYEPFLGSGIVFLNLKKQFDEYYLNDVEPNLTLFFKEYKNITNELFREVLELESQYHINENKLGYYEFRNLMNEEVNSTKKTIMLFMIGNSCINNMLRFNKNNMFNQGYGGPERSFQPNIVNFFNAIDYCKTKQIIVSSYDYKQILDNVKPNSLVFLDPPYLNTSASYNNLWSIQDTQYVIDFINTRKDVDFIYTDLKNECNSSLLNEYQVYTSEIRNISPNRKEETVHCELCITNLKELSIFDL